MQTIKIKVLLGIPLNKKEEAEYLLLIANDEEFAKYRKQQKK